MGSLKIDAVYMYNGKTVADLEGFWLTFPLKRITVATD